MAKIVGIGACVFDTLYNIPTYPTEDTKMRAAGSKVAGGGPVATGLVAASKLGESAAYIGVLSDDNGGVFLARGKKFATFLLWTFSQQAIFRVKNFILTRLFICWGNIFVHRNIYI